MKHTRNNFKYFYLFLLVLTIFSSGCATQTNEKMQSWLGHHQSELIASWGPPQKTASDGKGGTILIYESYVNLGQNPGRATTDYYGNITYTAPQQRGYNRARMFYVNPEGKIYSWRWRGL